ncbi:MAG: DNA polymerase III subunit epsilon [Candidatus Cloacimonadota bacterium]|nr:MAG: DNA polymerase III subunit epsilon [Candidatus Cloacimonadota bacterium]
MNKLFDFVALDIETTGFDFQNDEIIEIGAVKYKEGSASEQFSVFIKPEKEVPLFIKQLTHITDEQLAGGEKIRDALKSLRNFIGDKILVCHNASFDIGFLNVKLQDCDLPRISNRIFDTLEISKIYLPFVFNHKLGTVAKFFELNLENAHRAIYDAEVTGKILINLLKFIEENIPLKLNYHILEIARYIQPDTDLLFFLEKILEHQKKYAILSKSSPKIDPFRNNYIEHSVENPRELTIEEIFGTKGVFAEKFENYELREGQLQMAEAVLRNFESDEFLLAEAGTGVGKSFAYLIPAIIHTNKTQSRVVISTNTKNLQEQLFFKDLPTVKQCLNLPFKATLLKGRRNYICEKKWQESSLDFDKSFTPFEARHFIYLPVWKEFTKTGDISENTSFNLKFAGNTWKKLAAERHFCLGRKCAYFSRCSLMNVRQKAENSNLVIINHHLLLADMISDNSVLGEYEHLIIDEAHNLPHIAPAELGLSLGFNDFNNFFSQLFSVRGKYQSGILPNLKTAAVKSMIDDSRKKRLISLAEETINFIESEKNIFEEFFLNVGEEVEKKGKYGKLRVKREEDFPFLSKFLAEIIKFLEELSRLAVQIMNELSEIKSSHFFDYAVHTDNIDGVIKRIAEFYDGVTTLYNPDLQQNAYWLENFKTGNEKYPNGILNYAPLNINELMNELLYSKVKSIVFTSATVAIRGKFKYFASRMGLDLLENGKVRELIVPSPFDYQKQARVIVGGFLPDPKDKYFPSQSLKLIKKAIEISQVGTMVLFTSYKDLNYIYDELKEPFYHQEILLLCQGKGISRSALLSEFREHRESVLLGTNSFWEGIDVPGESLSLLILNKLPFMVPSEPIVEAYLEKLQAEGKDSFLHYMLPTALLRYRQGFGRLIRNKNDKGIVLVLDRRIATKFYGKYFIETVPAKTVIHETPIEIYDYLGKWFKGF